MRIYSLKLILKKKGLKKKDMDLQKKSYTELQTLFQVVFEDWKESNLQIDRVKKRECENFAQFARNRADLRQLARENARLHNKLVQIDFELQIRTWTGKND